MISDDILPDGRIKDALSRFIRHGAEHVALAGSVALAAQVARKTGERPVRDFGDIDLVAASLDALPAALTEEFLCPHVHGAAGAGRTLAQFLHPDDAVRIDIFGAIGQALARATPFRLGPQTIAVLSLEDQAARAAALSMKLTRNGSIAAKHVRDLERMRDTVSEGGADNVWLEYRAPSDPMRFHDAVALVDAAARAHPERLIVPEFYRDPARKCQDCMPHGAFRPADPTRIFAILGYV